MMIPHRMEGLLVKSEGYGQEGGAQVYSSIF